MIEQMKVILIMLEDAQNQLEGNNFVGASYRLGAIFVTLQTLISLEEVKNGQANQEAQS